MMPATGRIVALMTAKKGESKGGVREVVAASEHEKAETYNSSLHP
jgi:hypothetical protein